MNNILPEKIRSGRELRGLSQTALSDLLNTSKQMVSYYENGQREPTAEFILSLTNVLNLPLSYFTSPHLLAEERVSQLSFRKLYKTKKSEVVKANRIEEVVYHNFCVLSKYLEFSEPNVPQFSLGSSEDNLSQIEHIANEVRAFWGLKEGPISNVMKLLENNGILISFGKFSESDIDAFSVWRTSKPIIVLASGKSAVRQRFDLCHELGHLIFHKNHSSAYTVQYKKRLEQEADYFSSAFLLPKNTFLKEILSPTIEGFLLLKKRWGVSIQSMIMRSYHLGLINDNQKQYLFKKVNQRGYRRVEPMDSEIMNEAPTLYNKSFEILLDNKIPVSELVNQFGLNIEDIVKMHSIDKNLFINKEDNIKYIRKIRNQLQGKRL